MYDADRTHMTSSFDLLEMIQDVADRLISPRWRALAAGEVEEKRPGDFVTVADREAEQAITEALRRVFPQALVVGEEAVFANPLLLGALPSAEHAFVVDPVDGTRNFVQGSPDHAVMVGELRAGEPVRAWIWQPQHRRAYLAERGAGATCNGERLSVPQRAGRPYLESSVRGVSGVDSALLAQPVPPSSQCCGVDYPRVATGEVDALVYRSANPWDHVPGAVLLRELGGVVRAPDGSDYHPGTSGSSTVVVAGSPEIFNTVQAVLSEQG